MKNFYRLNNDLIINLNNKRERLELNCIGKSSTPTDTLINNTQIFINNIQNIVDFNDDEFDGEYEFNCINVDIMVRQNLVLNHNQYNAKQITLLFSNNGKKMISKFIFMYRDIKAINPISIDSSVFYGVVNLNLPISYFENDSVTLYNVEDVLFDGKPQTNFDDFISKHIVNLVGFEPLSKLNLELGNIENYVKRIDDYLEIGLINLNPYETIEQSIFKQLGIGEQLIKVTHVINYGFSDNINDGFENITVFKSVGLINNSNSIVPVEYRPIFDNVYDENSIHRILHILVESIIEVGSTKFTRYTENKFDFNELFMVNERVTVNPVEINHNIQNVQTIIETKTNIKPIVIQQPIGYKLASSNNTFEYIEDMVFGFVDLGEITEPNYVMTIEDSDNNNMFDLFGKLDTNNMLYFQPNSKQKSQLIESLKDKKLCRFYIKKIDTIGKDNMTIIKDGFITKKLN